MDNLITALLGAALFIAFVGGLAQSIGTPPFIMIVIFVVILFLVDLVQSARAGLKSKKPDQR